MTTYEVREFGRELEIDDDEEVVTAEISSSGTRESSRANNYALVESSTDSSEGVDGSECGYNGCSRTVSDPDERCWQHEDE